MKSDAGTIRADRLFGAGDTTSGVNQKIPDPAAGSAVNEYKTSLQLPGTHLGIHRAATHRLFIKHSLLYLESMKLSAVPGPIRTQGCLIIMILSLLYVATKLFLQT